MKTKCNVSDRTKITLVHALSKLDVPNGARLVTETAAGETPSQLEEFFRQLGFSVLAGEMLLEDLDHFFESVVIAGLNDRLVVVDNMNGDQIGYIDPEYGRIEASVSEFMSRWAGMGRTQYGIIVRQG